MKNKKGRKLRAAEQRVVAEVSKAVGPGVRVIVKRKPRSRQAKRKDEGRGRGGRGR
jgi:hypothetical protein